MQHGTQKMIAGFAVALVAGSLGLIAQTGTSGSGTGAGGGQGTSGQGTSGQGATGQGTTGSTATNPGGAQWSSTNYDPASDTSANQTTGNGITGNPNGGGIHPGDYLAPLSKLRWGPFSVLGWDAFASWSNQPLGYNGDTNGAAAASGIPNLGASTAVHLGSGASANWRWGTGFIGVQYTPSMDYQTATDFTQVNHNVSLYVDHPFRFGKWRMTMGLRTATASRLSTAFAPPQISPLLSLDAPITNQDILGLLLEPIPLQIPTPNLLLINNRFFSGQASASITRQLNARDNLTFSSSLFLNRTLDFGNQTGALFNYPQSSGANIAATYSHSINRRQNVSVQLSATQALGGGLTSGYASQQALQISYTWLPFRRWSFTVGAGPSRVQSQTQGTAIRYVSTVATSYTVPYGPIITAQYSRGFDLLGFAGGEDSKNININWGAPILNKGHRWHYSVTTAIQLAGSANASNYLGGNSNQLSTGAGFMISGQLTYPVTQALAFSANYGYFIQHINQGGTQVAAAFFQRNIVSAGFHYTFGGVSPGQRF